MWLFYSLVLYLDVFIVVVLRMKVEFFIRSQTNMAQSPLRYTHMYICMHVCIYVCVCVCVYNIGIEVWPSITLKEINWENEISKGVNWISFYNLHINSRLKIQVLNSQKLLLHGRHFCLNTTNTFEYKLK